MSDAVIIAIVVVVLVLVALAVVLPRVSGRGRTTPGSTERRPGVPGARRAGAGVDGPEARATGGESADIASDAVAARRSDAPDGDLAIPGFVAGAGGAAAGATSGEPERTGRAPQSDARARARELQWGEDRDFEWVDTRGTRPRRRFERDRSPEPRPEKRV